MVKRIMIYQDSRQPGFVRYILIDNDGEVLVRLHKAGRVNHTFDRLVQSIVENRVVSCPSIERSNGSNNFGAGDTA